MLQQTTVAAVVPYFDRFLAHFRPSNDSPPPTSKPCSGSGKGSAITAGRGICTGRPGVLAPNTAANCRTTRRCGGIYLAWAGTSSGRSCLRRSTTRCRFRGQLARVFCRLLGQDGEVGSPAVPPAGWEQAERVLPRQRIGDFNQALMEVGALVCLPRRTPPAMHVPCVAIGRPERRVAGRDSAEVRRSEADGSARGRDRRASRCAPCLCGGRGTPVAGRTCGSSRAASCNPAKPMTPPPFGLLAPLTGIDPELGPELATVRHGVTRFRITLVVLEAEYRGGRFRSPFYTRGVWVRPKELAEYPVSTPQRRLACVVAAKTRQRRLF